MSAGWHWRLVRQCIPREQGGGTQPGPGPQPSSDGREFLGKWAGQVSQPLPDGRILEWPMVLDVSFANGTWLWTKRLSAPCVEALGPCSPKAGSRTMPRNAW